MRVVSLLSLMGLVVGLAACASTSSYLPSGMSEGMFSRLSCEDGKSFQARFAEGGKSVRVRALHGATELAMTQIGVYEGDGYQLQLSGNDGLSLHHKGKVEARQCKVAL